MSRSIWLTSFSVEFEPFFSTFYRSPIPSHYVNELFMYLINWVHRRRLQTVCDRIPSFRAHQPVRERRRLRFNIHKMEGMMMLLVDVIVNLRRAQDALTFNNVQRSHTQKKHIFLNIFIMWRLIIGGLNYDLTSLSTAFQLFILESL